MKNLSPLQTLAFIVGAIAFALLFYAYLFALAIAS